MTTQTLIHHNDIQRWVTRRAGHPAVRRIPSRDGIVRQRLALSFSRGSSRSGTPTIDDGISPVSWSAWLAELDRQHLALRVGDAESYELVERKELN